MVRVETFTEAGADHRSNEDGFAVRPHPLDPDVWVCAVADGQGGRSGGERAARLACGIVLDTACAAPLAALADPKFWTDLLRSVDAAVEQDTAAGFTTLVALAMVRDSVVGVSQGDSAALLVTNGEAKKLTSGQHKEPPVGSAAASPVFFSAKVTPPWTLVLMTDGVWKYVGWGRVVEAARDAGSDLLASLQRVARLSVTGRFPDDFTAVVLRDDDHDAVAE